MAGVYSPSKEAFLSPKNPPRGACNSPTRRDWQQFCLHTTRSGNRGPAFTSRCLRSVLDASSGKERPARGEAGRPGLPTRPPLAGEEGNRFSSQPTRDLAEEGQAGLAGGCENTRHLAGTSQGLPPSAPTLLSALLMRASENRPQPCPTPSTHTHTHTHTHAVTCKRTHTHVPWAGRRLQ